MKECWRKRTSLEKKLIVGIFILGVAALVFLLIIIIIGKSNNEENEQNNVCTTKHCVEAAAELLEFIDTKEDPCLNFYRFACGSFYKNAVKKDSPSPWTSTETLFQNEIKSLVVDSIDKTDENAHVLIKQFYHECMNETKIDDENNRSFFDSINSLGGCPLINKTTWNKDGFNWAEWYIKAKNLGLPVIGFFDFQKIQINTNSTILRITGPGLNSENYYKKSRFINLMNKIADAFGVNNTSELKHDHEELHKFIEILYKFRSEDELDSDTFNENDDIDDDYDFIEKGIILTNVQNLSEICPFVPWLRILNGISGNSSQFNNLTEIAYDYEHLEKYCEDLGNLLNRTHSKVIMNYYMWSIVHNSHKYMNDEIRGIYQEIDGEDDDRFKICYNAVDERFKYVKETIYVRKKTNPEVKSQILEMIQIMKELFAEHLEKSDWMDDITRTAAVEKAEIIESVIGGDDVLYEDTFDKILGVDDFKFTSNNIFKMFQEKMLKETHHFFETVYGPAEENWESFFKNAIAVNAYFLPSVNIMIIPAPILTSIFFNKKFPAYMNYGSMGSTVGHEFMHGFSKISREVILQDDSVIDWWTNATEKAYDRKVKCIIDEYESIPFRYRLNGTLTLEENVADYVGADLGYEAYMKYVEKHGEEVELPGVSLTPGQTYWVQTATNFCFRKLDDNSIDYEEEDLHAIPAFRVQAPARHSSHFAEAFNCPVETFMNPTNKCKIL